MIDLAQLQRAIDEAPETGPVAGVTRRFLEQVLEELRLGRAVGTRLMLHEATALMCSQIERRQRRRIG